MGESVAGVKDFINEHLVKVLWGVSLYFLTQLSADFKDVKLTLQQLLINQATMQARLDAVEGTTRQNTADLRDLRAYHEKGGRD